MNDRLMVEKPMTPQGADRAGFLLAIAALMGASLFALAALLFAARGLF